MPKTKVCPGGQVKIPSSFAKKYDLQEGDILDVEDLGGGLIFIPEKVRKDKKLREELNKHIWDKMEEEAEEDIKAGRVSGPFDKVEDLVKHLRKG